MKLIIEKIGSALIISVNNGSTIKETKNGILKLILDLSIWKDLRIDYIHNGNYILKNVSAEYAYAWLCGENE